MRSVESLQEQPRLKAADLRSSAGELLGTALLPHGISYLQKHVQVASLDHALWFHRPFRADEWLLYSLDSPSAQGARGINRGLVFTRDGRLVASTAQEGMMRLADGKPS